MIAHPIIRYWNFRELLLWQQTVSTGNEKAPLYHSNWLFFEFRFLYVAHATMSFFFCFAFVSISSRFYDFSVQIAVPFVLIRFTLEHTNYDQCLKQNRIRTVNNTRTVIRIETNVVGKKKCTRIFASAVTLSDYEWSKMRKYTNPQKRISNVHAIFSNKYERNQMRKPTAKLATNKCVFQLILCVCVFFLYLFCTRLKSGKTLLIAWIVRCDRQWRMAYGIEYKSFSDLVATAGSGCVCVSRRFFLWLFFIPCSFASRQNEKKKLWRIQRRKNELEWQQRHKM